MYTNTQLLRMINKPKKKTWMERINRFLKERGLR